MAETGRVGVRIDELVCLAVVLFSDFRERQLFCWSWHRASERHYGLGGYLCSLIDDEMMVLNLVELS